MLSPREGAVKTKQNVLSLEDRRFLSNVDISSFIEFYSYFERYPLRGRDDVTLKKNYASFKCSVFNRIVDMWNVLPLSIHQSSSISGFKKGVRD